MPDIIINPNQITIDVTPSDNISIAPEETGTQTVIETQVTEPNILINTSPFSQEAESAKEIVFSAECGESIPKNRCVYLNNSGLAFLGSHLSLSTAQVIGVSKTAGLTGEIIKFIVFGRVDDISFIDPAGTPLFLTTSGQFSSVATGSGVNKEIGQSLQVGSIFVNIKPAMLYAI